MTLVNLRKSIIMTDLNGLRVKLIVKSSYLTPQKINEHPI